MANEIEVTVSVEITEAILDVCEVCQQTYVNGHQGALPHYVFFSCLIKCSRFSQVDSAQW
jgi:hypothetical protein